MDFIGYVFSFLFIIMIMTPPVSMLITLVYWLYRRFSGHLSPKNEDSCYIMTEEDEAELLQIIEDLKNEGKKGK